MKDEFSEIDGVASLAKRVQAGASKLRKPGAGVTVRFSEIREVGGESSTVVRTVRSNSTGALLANDAFPLQAEAEGLPLPDMLTLANKP